MLSAETHWGNPEATAEESYGRFLYNRFRYYDPGIGRYVSADPIGQAGGVNVFAYANLNPLVYLDSLGLSEDSPELEKVKKRWEDVIEDIQDRSRPKSYERTLACMIRFGATACKADMAPFISEDPSREEELCTWCSKKRQECISGDSEEGEGSPDLEIGPAPRSEPDITPESHLPDFGINSGQKPRGIERRGPKVQ